MCAGAEGAGEPAGGPAGGADHPQADGPGGQRAPEDGGRGPALHRGGQRRCPAGLQGGRQ